jgi:hypothetical protein
MSENNKKQTKAQAKADKKRAKAQVKRDKTFLSNGEGSRKSVIEKPSPMIHFAEIIKGIIYLVFALSLFVAVLLGQRGVIITLDDIIDSFLLASLGKFALIIIALGFLIYGLKNLRLVK